MSFTGAWSTGSTAPAPTGGGGSGWSTGPSTPGGGGGWSFAPAPSSGSGGGWFAPSTVYAPASYSAPAGGGWYYGDPYGGGGLVWGPAIGAFGEGGPYVELDYPEMRFLRAGENPTELLNDLRRGKLAAPGKLAQTLIIGLVALALLK